MNDINKEIKEDLDPILDVFGGADGGLAFARLKFKFLPTLYENYMSHDEYQELKVCVKKFSKLCEIMLIKG